MLNYRNSAGVLAVLADLAEQTCAPERVLVVDNASGDGSAARIQQGIESLGIAARIHQMAANNGYAAGMNAGIREATSNAAKPDLLLLCTHDVRLERTCLERLVGALAAHDGAAVAAPLLGWASRSEQVWSSGGAVSTGTGRPHHLGTGRPIDVARTEAPQTVAWLDGAVLLVQRVVAEQVGPMDESFFMYSEELEWLLRVTDTGRTLLVVPDAVAWQEPGMAPPYLEQRNRVQLYRVRRKPWYVATSVVAGFRAAARDALHGNAGSARLRLAGVMHGLTGQLDREKALRR